jgi:hypothetical protein
MTRSEREGPGASLRGGTTIRPVRLAPLNWAVLAAALVCIVAGYASLAAGSTVWAPVLLVVGYCVLIPLGIFL